MPHTPGPWTVDDDGDIIGNGELLANAYNMHPASGGSKEANAQLIASAPDLLEACKAAMLSLDAITRNGKYINIGLRKQGLPGLDIEMLRLKTQRCVDAIAKAEGKTNA